MKIETEQVEPADDIEWGEWYVGLPCTADELQARRIKGVWEYRVRKAPPPPVVETVVCHGRVASGYSVKKYAIFNGDFDGPDSPFTFAMTFQTRDGEVDTSVPPTAEWVK